jgi:ribonuclease VapC
MVEKHLNGALMSTVNYSEVLKKVIEKGGNAEAAAGLVRRSRVELVDFDSDHGRVAAELWPLGKGLGLSFADRACLALGMAVSGTVLTADRAMAEAAVPVKVVMIREGH